MSKNEFPKDFYTHQQSWRNALVIAEANGKVELPDVDEKSYWQHELKAFDRAYRELELQGQLQGDFVNVSRKKLVELLSSVNGDCYQGKKFEEYMVEDLLKSIGTQVASQNSTNQVHETILPQGAACVVKLIEAGLNSLAHLPAAQKSEMISALNLFRENSVPTSVSFEDIDSCLERADVSLTIDDKVEVMKQLIAVSKMEPAKEQIIDISRLVSQRPSGENDESFDPDQTLPSLPQY